MAGTRAMVGLVAGVVASLVAPPRCAACDARVPRLVAFCCACASTVEREREGELPSMAAFVYGGAVARAVTRLKYERRPDLGRVLGELLGSRIRESCRNRSHEAWLGGAVVVPVPLHKSRLAGRGFNQSMLIALPVSKELHIPMFPLALMRLRDTPQQASLDRRGRIANVAGAFRVREVSRIAGRRVLLVDDVCTTGATIEACTQALLAAGATSVAHAVVARA